MCDPAGGLAEDRMVAVVDDAVVVAPVVMAPVVMAPVVMAHRVVPRGVVVTTMVAACGCRLRGRRGSQHGEDDAGQQADDGDQAWGGVGRRTVGRTECGQGVGHTDSFPRL
jgi:hypothetical protein